AHERRDCRLDLVFHGGVHLGLHRRVDSALDLGRDGRFDLGLDGLLDGRLDLVGDGGCYSQVDSDVDLGFDLRFGLGFDLRVRVVLQLRVDVAVELALRSQTRVEIGARKAAQARAAQLERGLLAHARLRGRAQLSVDAARFVFRVGVANEAERQGDGGCHQCHVSTHSQVLPGGDPVWRTLRNAPLFPRTCGVMSRSENRRGSRSGGNKPAARPLSQCPRALTRDHRRKGTRRTDRGGTVMKAQALALIIAASLSVGSAALAQQTTVRGNASADSQTSVSADRQGANVASDNRAQGGVAAERTNDDGSRRHATADTAGASEMNATLERSVDARRAKPGDQVTAKTNESYTTASGMTIPRGSRLVGRVTDARAHARGEGEAASQLGIAFERAELPDGRVVPMQATIQAVAAARSQAQSE